MPEFYIRGQQYSLDQIKKLTRTDFCLQNITNMPLSLYKYFPNVASSDTGINYSQEALINNTVHLSSPTEFDDPYDCTILANEQEFALKRITYYAKRCGINVQPEWDYYKIVYELSLYLYEGSKKGISLGELFSFKSTSKQLSDLRLEAFILNLKIGIDNEFQNFTDVWQRSFNKAIQHEYIDDVQNSTKNFRISCFAESQYSILMWSHYAMEFFMRDGYSFFAANDCERENIEAIIKAVPKYLCDFKGKSVVVRKSINHEAFSTWNPDNDNEDLLIVEKFVISDFDYGVRKKSG